MRILALAQRLGLEPIMLDRYVAMIRCPWCGDPCYLALHFDRFNCNRCGNCGFAEFLEEKVLRDRRNSPVSN